MLNFRRQTQVYVVDPARAVREIVAMLVAADRSYALCGTAPNAESALKAIDHAQPDMMLVELDLPGMDGLALLDAVRRHWKPMQVIVISGSVGPDESLCNMAFSHGAEACFDMSRLITNWRELMHLMDEVRAETGMMCVQAPSAATLPALRGEDQLDDFAQSGLRAMF